MAGCPRDGCGHSVAVHALEPHGPWNVYQRTGRCQASGCACPARDDGPEHAQAAYVRAWREEHPEHLYGTASFCPLCNCLVDQARAGCGALGGNPLQEHGERQHGADWSAYLALGTVGAPQAPSEGEE